ncbi:MAG: hypothetical protein ACK5V5_06340 [Cyclobacteriaceae bacterium]|jgi:hypothetical protein|nr:hypothetical protein [Flammeovirgaceae bacterium]
MRLFFFTAYIFVASIAVAQPGDPGGGGNPTVPISGIEILIGAGAAYGFSRKWLGKKQRKG